MDELRDSPESSISETADRQSDDDYATFVKNCKGFNIFLVDDQYYALTADFGEKLSNKVVKAQCSLTNNALLQLEDAIDEAISFSNSRGQFNNQFRQKVKGAFMKAESVHDNKLDSAEPGSSLPLGKVVYIKERNEYFFITPDEITNAEFNNINDVFVNAYYASSQPELTASIGDYNLVSFDTQVFAVKQGVPVDDFEWRSGFITSRPDVASFSDAKDAVQFVKSRSKVGIQSTQADSSVSAPVLVETDDSRQINYVFYQGLYYAIPNSLGSIKVEDLPSNIPEGVTLSDSLDSLKQFSSQQTDGQLDIKPPEANQLVDSSKADIPQLVRSEANYNIVLFGGYYLAIPHSVGEIDLLETDFMSIPEIVRDVSLHVIEDYIAEQNRLTKADSQGDSTQVSAALSNSSTTESTTSLSQLQGDDEKATVAKLQAQLKQAKLMISSQRRQLEQAQTTIAEMQSSKTWRLATAIKSSWVWRKSQSGWRRFKQIARPVKAKLKKYI